MLIFILKKEFDVKLIVFLYCIEVSFFKERMVCKII